MKLSRRELILLTILIVLGIGTVFYWLFSAVQTGEMSRLKADLKANSQRLTELKAIQGEEEYIKKVKNLDIEIKSIERKLPYIKDVPGFLVELYYLITDSGLDGNNVSFSGVTEEKTYNYFNVSFTIKGEKDKVYEFLRQLENFKRQVSIENITFSVDSTNLFNTSINLRAYLLKGSEVTKEPNDYDFMQGKYGAFKDLYDIFVN